MRVLCLDIEGGYGGSSRSLYFFLKHMDRARVTPEVWCKREGPVTGLYEALGIPCRVEPAMPKFTSVPRLSRNLYLTGRGLWDSWRAGDFLDRLAEAARERFDLVHFNHEGLYHLAHRLRGRVGSPATMHVRTRPPAGPFARFQARTMCRSVDRLVYITENEREHVRALGGQCPGEVVYNIVEPPGQNAEPWPGLPRDKFLVASISNFSHTRGVHLLADLAGALRAMGRDDVHFVVAGSMDVPRSFPGELGAVARRGGNFADYVGERGLAGMFTFLGHVGEPERVLAACPALVKLELGLCPWSRDILEAMAFGRAVVTVGEYETFVSPGETGIMLPRFDAPEMARRLAALADDPALAERLGRAARERVAALCDGPSRAADLAAVWEDAVTGRDATTGGRR